MRIRIHDLPFYLWGAHVALLPFYLWPSGRPQVAHMLMLATLACALSIVGRSRNNVNVAHALRRHAKAIVLVVGLFAAYVVAVNLFWSFTIGRVRPLLFSSFQIYNLLLAFLFYRLAQFDVLFLIKATRVGFFVALVSTLIALGSAGFSFSYRASGLFNNPNQLAFFSISAAMVFLTCQRCRIGHQTINRLAIILCGLVCIFSLSRAGLVSIGVLLLLSMLVESLKPRAVILWIIGAAVLVPVIQQADVVGHFERKALRAEAVYGNELAGRGYDRMLQAPHLMIFGAGEGGASRFDGALADKDAEMHSTIGTVVFSYGIPGTLLYLSFIVLLMRHSRDWVLVVAITVPLLYGITHNGLRFSSCYIAFFLIALAGVVKAQLNFVAVQRLINRYPGSTNPVGRVARPI